MCLWRSLLRRGGGDQHEADGGDPAEKSLAEPQEQKQGKALGKSHEAEDDAVEERPGLVEELRADARREASPEGGSDGGDQGRDPHDQTDPEHRLLRAVLADFQDIEGHEGHDAVERKGNPELGDGDGEDALLGIPGRRDGLRCRRLGRIHVTRTERGWFFVVINPPPSQRGSVPGCLNMVENVLATCFRSSIGVEPTTIQPTRGV